MEDLGFDVSGILSDEEAAKLFENMSKQTEDNNDVDKQQDADGAKKDDQDADNPEPHQEGVGVEEGNDDTVNKQDGDSSPNVYSSIVSALKNDGIIPDFEDGEIESVTTPDAFAEFFEKVIKARTDERTQRVYDALNNGMKPDEVRSYEDTIEYLNSIEEKDLRAEGPEAEDLRRHLIYNDLINRGYSEDKAKKEIEKSFKSASDIDDAMDSLEALKKFYGDSYKKKQEDAERQATAYREEQKKQNETFKKMVLEDDVKIGETVLSKKVCERIYDAVSRPVYKDKDTGKLFTAVQKFQKDNPLEFLKQLGMWYVLTDGGKDLTGFTKEQVVAEKNKSIKELERKINSTMLNSDGSLSYAGGIGKGSGNDPLLSDDWKIG